MHKPNWDLWIRNVARVILAIPLVPLALTLAATCWPLAVGVGLALAADDGDDTAWPIVGVLCGIAGVTAWADLFIAPVLWPWLMQVVRSLGR